MTTLHTREAAGMRAEIVELGELSVLARSRAPGLAKFLCAFLLHGPVDGSCCGRQPWCNIAFLPSSRYRWLTWFAYFFIAQDARMRATLGRFRFTREELR